MIRAAHVSWCPNLVLLSALVVFGITFQAFEGSVRSDFVFERSVCRCAYSKSRIDGAILTGAALRIRPPCLLFELL
jgi:hypothetical protein